MQLKIEQFCFEEFEDKKEIICENGKCYDPHNLKCEEKFSDITDIIGCEYEN